MAEGGEAVSINLAEARALAAAAREDTSAGLEARERLADVVDALVDRLDAESDLPRLEWATVQRWPSDGHEEICGPSSESLARRRFTEYPAMHRALLQRTVTYGPWTEVASKEADDARR